MKKNVPYLPYIYSNDSQQGPNLNRYCLCKQLNGFVFKNESFWMITFHFECM